MAASLTLLPALLGFAGERDGPAARAVHRPPRGGRPRRLARRALEPHRAAPARGRPRSPRWRVLLLLAAPVAGLRLGYPDPGNDPRGTTTRAAYDLVAEGSARARTAHSCWPRELTRPASVADVDALPARLRHEPGVAAVSAPAFNRAGDTAVLTVTPTTSPQDTRQGADRTCARRPADARPPDVDVGGATARRSTRARRPPPGCRCSSGRSSSCRFLLLGRVPLAGGRAQGRRDEPAVDRRRLRRRRAGRRGRLGRAARRDRHRRPRSRRSSR